MSDYMAAIPTPEGLREFWQQAIVLGNGPYDVDYVRRDAKAIADATGRPVVVPVLLTTRSRGCRCHHPEGLDVEERSDAYVYPRGWREP